MILKPHCIFCNKEGRRKIKEKGVWTTEATTVFECQCLKLQKIKGTRSSHGGSEVLIFLHEKQVFTAAVAGSIRESQLTGEVQMTKTREGRRTLKSHTGQPSRKFVMWLKKKSFKVKESWNFLTRVKCTYLLLIKHSEPGYKVEKLREKWHLRADTAILFTEQWREV